MYNMKKKVLGIIPSRYASTRFPGKPLVKINGVSMIQRVYEQCMKSHLLTHVLVATDDKRIKKHVQSFGGNVVMTSPDHQSGTDRCLEAYKLFCSNNPDYIPDVIVNIQGDEPLIDPKDIDLLSAAFSDKSVKIATLATPFSDSKQVEGYNSVKIVCNSRGKALYFSRSVIPFFRNKAPVPQLFLKHIGIYAFQTKTLERICKLSVSALENAESLEQLRWLENGVDIKVLVTQNDGLCVDVPEDVKNIEHFLIKNCLK